ncbi:MAG: ATP-dependent 6-phosphofructokinase [Chitinivibrionales bacterium]|nr:ATP-dependent 6-phosphofructokinase [Chitinivibrionales bacterium]
MTNSTVDFSITRLGSPTVKSPISLSKVDDDYIANYVDDSEGLLYSITMPRTDHTLQIKANEILELAGPREKIYFDPTKVNAAVVTCGGLCPGLNAVVRAIVMCLWYRYGVRRISGIQYGYRGFLPEFEFPTIELNPDAVIDIHNDGGTMLGSSRGYGDRITDIADCLERMNINMLFVIGGDGTQKGALALTQEAAKRNLKIAVVGVPKTIDNDLSYVQKSFGFETAVASAVAAVAGAHVEAHDAVNGIGIVKVMGRESGFIAAHTALAINDVNFVLIPEVPFDLYGYNGLFWHLRERLKDRNHAVILVAEGAGQELLAKSNAVDASGNKKLSDIGIYLRDEISQYFKQENMEINVKYIDPSYIIRSLPANPNDKLYCARLGTNAVHAAMTGKTGVLISLVHDCFVHVPMSMAVSKKNRIDPDSPLWRDVIETTGQPFLFKSEQ